MVRAVSIEGALASSSMTLAATHPESSSLSCTLYQSPELFLAMIWYVSPLLAMAIAS